MEKHPLGRYIVADPEICHGEPTFRGTRILVSDILEQVAGFVRRVLRHGSFRHRALRMGKVVRAGHRGLQVLEPHRTKHVDIAWNE